MGSRTAKRFRRMHQNENEDVKELYEYIPHGTKVTIIHESQPFRELKDGMIGSDVYRVQTALKALGYYMAGVTADTEKTRKKPFWHSKRTIISPGQELSI